MHIKKFCQQFLLWIAIAVNGLVWAQPNSMSLYMVTVPVASKQSMDHDQALLTALQQVLVKATGDSALLEMQSLPTTIPDPSSLVVEERYVENDTGLQLEVAFEPAQIHTFLTKVGQSIWLKRPLVLVWLAVDDGKNKQIVSVETDATWTKLVLQNAERRGVKFIFPAMDLHELNLVTVKDVWKLREKPLLEIAKQYQAQAVMIGHIAKGKDSWLSEGVLLFNKQSNKWQLATKTPEESAQMMVDKATDFLAKKNNVEIKQAINSNNQILLTVTHVDSVTQYAKVLAYLKNLSVVSQIDVTHVQPTQVIFAVEVTGGKEAFIKIVKKDGRLRHQATANNIDNTHLTYRWVP